MAKIKDLGKEINKLKKKARSQKWINLLPIFRDGK